MANHCSNCGNADHPEELIYMDDHYNIHGCETCCNTEYSSAQLLCESCIYNIQKLNYFIDKYCICYGCENFIDIRSMVEWKYKMLNVCQSIQNNQ
jgi:hypothetical protein